MGTLDNSKQFRLEEYKCLKNEIIHHMGRQHDTLKISILFFAGIAAWYLSSLGVGDDNSLGFLADTAGFVPLVTTSMLYSMWESYAAEILKKGAYLKSIEESLSSDGRGWEHRVEKIRSEKRWDDWKAARWLFRGLLIASIMLFCLALWNLSSRFSAATTGACAESQDLG